MQYQEAIRIIKENWEFDKMPTDLWIALDLVLFRNKVFKKRHETTMIAEAYKDLTNDKKRLVKDFLIFLGKRGQMRDETTVYEGI